MAKIAQIPAGEFSEFEKGQFKLVRIQVLIEDDGVEVARHNNVRIQPEV